MVTFFCFGEVASHDRLRDQTAEGACSLLCVRYRGNSGDQKIAFGSPAFCNYNWTLLLMSLFCLLAMLYSLCLLQGSLCKWRLCRKQNKYKYLRCISDVNKLGVVQLHLANVIEYNMLSVWLFKIVMMYSSLLEYHSFYYVLVVETMHQRCFYKVLADVGCANDKKYSYETSLRCCIGLPSCRFKTS